MFSIAVHQWSSIFLSSLKMPSLVFPRAALVFGERVKDLFSRSVFRVLESQMPRADRVVKTRFLKDRFKRARSGPF